jgi:homocysteine S-methyltransferase
MNSGLAKRILVLDGGMVSAREPGYEADRQGTTLESAGVDVSSPLWGSDLLLTNPKPIIDVHKGYINAGADLVESST